MVKKGYIRTLEALLAVIITLVVLASFIPVSSPTETRREAQQVLITLRENTAFRSCVYNKDTDCINTSIRAQLPQSYDFALNLSSDETGNPDVLPDKRVFAESAVITGNNTHNRFQVVRLYYWSRN